MLLCGQTGRVLTLSMGAFNYSLHREGMAANTVHGEYWFQCCYCRFIKFYMHRHIQTVNYCEKMNKWVEKQMQMLQDTRAQRMVWWGQKWCEPNATTFTVTRSQTSCTTLGYFVATCWTALSTASIKTSNEGMFFGWILFIFPVEFHTLG